VKLRGFIVGMATGGVVAGISAFAVMREVRRKRDVEVFGDAVAKVTGQMMETVQRILVPPMDLPPERDVVHTRTMTREQVQQEYGGNGAQSSKGTPIPWYLGGPDDIPDDADLDPTDLNTPLDRAQPMQPGSIGPVLQGGIFDEPMPEGDWDQDRRGPRTVAYDHDENPLHDIGLVAPQTDITEGGS